MELSHTPCAGNQVLHKILGHCGVLQLLSSHGVGHSWSFCSLSHVHHHQQDMFTVLQGKSCKDVHNSHKYFAHISVLDLSTSSSGSFHDWHLGSDRT